MPPTWYKMRHWAYDASWGNAHYYTHRSLLGEMATFEEGRLTSYSHPSSYYPTTRIEIKEHYHHGKR